VTSEFQLIAQLQRRFASQQQSLPYAPLLGIGDDAAVLAIPPGKHLVVTTDTLVSDVHFFAADTPADIAVKSLAVNLSDLAAMGAEPAWFFLALTLPEINPQWCDEFAGGLFEIATAGRIHLAGGDTTQGPLSITITAMGLVGQNQALRRDGAKPGELIVVSGQPGLAALALRQEMAGESVSPEAWRALKQPQPRLALGLELVGKASACIDISDGLAADLGHILKASNCGAEIRLEQLPQAAALGALDADTRQALQLGGGDDYELCFTLPRQYQHELAGIQQRSGVALQVIGETTAGSDLKLWRADGREYELQRAGHEHFASRPA
jgi:thiamine-monophosphate kinase